MDGAPRMCLCACANIDLSARVIITGRTYDRPGRRNPIRGGASPQLPQRYNIRNACFGIQFVQPCLACRPRETRNHGSAQSSRLEKLTTPGTQPVGHDV